MQNHSNTAVLTAELPADAAENEKLIEQAYEALDGAEENKPENRNKPSKWDR